MEHPNPKQLRNNPVFVTSLACVVAIVMFLISFTTYYRSDTRRTIAKIQQNNLASSKSKPNVYRQTDLSKQGLDGLRQDIADKVFAHSDDNEFSADNLTDSALGL